MALSGAINADMYDMLIAILSKQASTLNADCRPDRYIKALLDMGYYVEATAP